MKAYYIRHNEPGRQAGRQRENFKKKKHRPWAWIISTSLILHTHTHTHTHTMYAVARQHQVPTAIEHCIQAQVTSPQAVNLVIAKNTTLEIYAVRSNLKVPFYLLATFIIQNILNYCCVPFGFVLICIVIVGRPGSKESSC